MFVPFLGQSVLSPQVFLADYFIVQITHIDMLQYTEFKVIN